MAPRRETFVLVVVAIVVPAALLDIVYIIANDTVCEAPGRPGCTKLSLWALMTPYLIVALGLICAGVGYYIHRRDPQDDN